MQPTFSFPKKSLSLVFVCAFLTACSSMLGAEDDESIYGSVRLPPRVSEANARKAPIVIPLKNNEPPVSLSSPAPVVEPIAIPKPASLEISQPAADAVVAKVVPAAAPPKAAAPAPDETAAAAPMLFAPYIATLREGDLPRLWQKQPSYDFPWIPGALPTRTNEETVVGYGEQMLGRLYAHASFSDRTAPAPAITESVQVKPVPPAKDKKAGKNAKNADPAAEPSPAPVVDKTVSNKKLLQCEGGATCLDAARDVLVEDAKAKGWEMLLSRRVSLHNSFQFSRGERVIWVELNSNGKREMDIEYTLLPLQAKDKK